jgi:hypothetical protein
MLSSSSTTKIRNLSISPSTRNGNTRPRLGGMVRHRLACVNADWRPDRRKPRSGAARSAPNIAASAFQPGREAFSPCRSGVQLVRLPSLAVLGWDRPPPTPVRAAAGPSPIPPTHPAAVQTPDRTRPVGTQHRCKPPLSRRKPICSVVRRQSDTSASAPRRCWVPTGRISRRRFATAPPAGNPRQMGITWCLAPRSCGRGAIFCCGPGAILAPLFGGFLALAQVLGSR